MYRIAFIIYGNILVFSINTQVIIENCEHWLVKIKLPRITVLRDNNYLIRNGRPVFIFSLWVFIFTVVFYFFQRITCVFVLKQSFASGSVIMVKIHLDIVSVNIHR